MHDTPRHTRTMTLRPRTRWGRRLGYLALLMVGLLVGYHLGLGQWAKGKLEKQVAAYRAAGEPMTPGEVARLGADAVADADNAVPLLRSAADRIDWASPAWRRFDGLDEYELRPPLRDWEVQRLRKLVGAHGQALGEVLEASHKPGVNWQLKFDELMVPAGPSDLQRQWDLGRLLGAAALLAHYDGDDAGALRRVRELLFVSRALRRQPTLDSHFISNELCELAARRLTQIAPGVRVAGAESGSEVRAGGPVTEEGRGPVMPGQLGALVAEFLDTQCIHESRLRAARGDRAAQLAAATAIAEGALPLRRVWERRSRSGGGLEPRPRAAAVEHFILRPIALNDARILLDHATAFIESGAAADLPEHLAKSPQFAFEPSRECRLHIVADVLTPRYHHLLVRDYAAITARRLAATALAMRWYAAEHQGELPVRLEDLVPNYLKAIPADPMAAGRPLRYVSGGRPLIYSVGENGRDDQGKERLSTQSFFEARAVTDVVVHLKQQPRPPEEEPEPETH